MRSNHKKAWTCAVIVTFILFFYTFSFAQTESITGVQFKDGSVIYGRVIKLNVYDIDIQTPDGKIISRKFADVDVFYKDTGVVAKHEVKQAPEEEKVSHVALSVEGPYISGHFGVGLLTDSDISEPGATGKIEFDPGLALGIAAGYNFGEVRLEGEIGYQKNDIDKISACAGGLCISGIGASGDATSTSFLANGYYDFVNTSPFTPYISAGVGLAKIEVDDFSVVGINIGSADDTVFAYQLGVGVGYAVNKNLTIDLKYRYFATEDLDLGSTKAECASHNFYIGLRYNF